MTSYRVNSYLAIFFITVAGAGAALTIVRVATDDMLVRTMQSNQENYFLLQQSLLSVK